MKYKHCIALSLLIIWSSVNNVLACGPEYYPVPGDYDLFKIIPAENSSSNNAQADDNIRLWHKYVHQQVALQDISAAVYKATLEYTQFVDKHFDELRQNKNTTDYPFFDYLLKTNDKEAMEYLLLAKRCETSRFKYYDPWYYPSKDDLEFTDLKQIYQEAIAYKGSKLKSRYLLQAIRAAYSMLRYDDCLSLWENEVMLLPSDAITQMSATYIGSIYFRLQEYEKAAFIYSATNDITSLKWCIAKLEEPSDELETIQTIYKYAPQYPDFPDMVASFIRRAERTTVRKWVTGSYWSWYSDDDYSKQRETYQQLLLFANRVVKEKQCHDPAYWQSVASYLTFLDGDYKKANTMLRKAEAMKGEVSTHNNIRVLRILYDAVLCKYDRKYEHKLLSQLQWLYQMAEKTPFNENRIYNYRNHYTDVLERLVDYHWVPNLRKQGDTNKVCGLIGLKSEIRSKHFSHRTEKADSVDWFWNNDYSTPIFNHLDTLSTKEVLAYKKYLFGKPQSQLDKFITGRCYQNEMYYNELIATKYIRTADFEEAASYLKNVSDEFLSRQNILHYLVNKDEKTDIWFYGPNRYYDWEYFNRKDFKGRYDNKLHFCQKMITLKRQLNGNLSAAVKSTLLYQYGTKLFHASYQGKLWAITHYGKGGTYGGGENGPLDSSKPLDVLDVLAMEYFKKAEELADNPGIKAKSIYAQAYMMGNACINYDWKEGKLHSTINWQSQQCELYNKMLVNAHHEEFRHFIQRCDQLMHYSLKLQELW